MIIKVMGLINMKMINLKNLIKMKNNNGNNGIYKKFMIELLL